MLVLFTGKGPPLPTYQGLQLWLTVKSPTDTEAPLRPHAYRRDRPNITRPWKHADHSYATATDSWTGTLNCCAGTKSNHRQLVAR